ncbi:MAG: SIR2 family protein [Gammaproteobacteria bacterium]|nr:SIR2 family protein [Gammaproteobacteria bacterium]
MPDTTTDLSTRLAFSIYQSPGVYALLLGSGMSRAAQIPTGWEITLDLVRRLAALDGVSSHSDWAAWYRKSTGKEPDYSEVVRELGRSPEERRALLHSYMEPTDEERGRGVKTPTEAHRAVARLVRDGYVRVIVTTNFDRLMENALREHGVEPTVVASEDALRGAEPAAHSSCFLFKLHGDYKDSRIRNTDAELSEYPEGYDAFLDRVFDEYGLVVCGWSGEWDAALRNAVLRAPSRRYPTYWAARGEPGGAAGELIAHRRASVVPISDADSFFGDLANRLEVVARSHRQSPQNVEMLLGTVKQLLAEPERNRIALEDLLSSEIRKLLDNETIASMPLHGDVTREEFQRRVAVYEAATEPLARVLALLGRWGSDMEFDSVLNAILAVFRSANEPQGGMSLWLELREYPSVLLVSAYGLSLVQARRWDVLHRLFNRRIERYQSPKPERLVDVLYAGWWGADDHWKLLEGMENNRLALSNHLAELFSEWGGETMGLLADFDRLYDTWEIVATVEFMGQYSQAELGTGERPFVPLGRFSLGRRRNVLPRVLNGALVADLLAAGFSEGNRERLLLAARQMGKRGSW